MNIWSRINDIWRKNKTSYVKIDGVWRSSNVYVNTNNVWRQTYQSEIKVDNIIGFKLIYQLSPEERFPLHPHLKFNPNLPTIFKLTGEDQTFNTDEKGVIFHYQRGLTPQGGNHNAEGIEKYKGSLYVILDTGELINITSNQVDERLNDFSIILRGFTFLDKHFWHLQGWNSLFNIKNHWDFFDPPEDGEIVKYRTRYLTGPSETEHNTTIELSVNLIPIKKVSPWLGGDRQRLYFTLRELQNNAYNEYKEITILPQSERHINYDEYARIGIARNINQPGINMVGSEGLLDQTIMEISVNNIIKPFYIEIHK